MAKKETAKQKNVISKILKILRDDRATPEQVRYYFKRVREQGGYQVSKKSKELPNFLNEVEIDYIRNKAIQNGDATTTLLLNMAIFTGLRINELNNLKIPDIDLANRQLKVIKGKGNKDRYVPITNGIMELIVTYIGNRSSGNLFVKSNHTKYSKRALQKKIEKLLKQCAFAKKLSTHSLRHTFGTLLRSQGMSLEKIQLLMGHSSIKTTEIYAHLELAPVKREYIEMVGNM